MEVRDKKVVEKYKEAKKFVDAYDREYAFQMYGRHEKENWDKWSMIWQYRREIDARQNQLKRNKFVSLVTHPWLGPYVSQINYRRGVIKELLKEIYKK